MSRDLLSEMMNGQNGVWTVAIIAGVLVGLLDLWLSYRSWRASRRTEIGQEPEAEALEVQAPAASSVPAGRPFREEAPKPLAAFAPQPTAQPVSRAQQPAPAPARRPEPAPPATLARQPAPAPRRPPEPPPQPAVPSFPRRRLADAVDPSLTAEELLERAEQLMASGAREQAAAHFRGAIRMAQKNKQPAVEAQARIELGDLSKANGDLTSACEHWQMARVLFAGLDKPSDVKTTVERMEKAGCPTDWVLNEF